MVDQFTFPLVLAGADEAIGFVAVGGGLFVAVVGIVCGTISRIFRTRAYEASRREIAAYVAEGSIRPEDAERILATQVKPCGRQES